MRKKYAHVKFILPGFVFYTCFVIFPIIYVFYLSLFNWSGMGPMEFVGLGNFKTIFTDPKFSPAFFKALLNNIKYLLCIWLIVTPYQYLIAYFLFIKIPAHRYLRFMIFMPYVISSTIVSFFATMLFNPNIGFLNKFLAAVGLEHLQGAWFGDPDWAFKLLIFLVIWQSAGSGIMIFYSNFLDISRDIMEACRMDGCSEWQRFLHILVPLCPCRPVPPLLP